MTLRNWLSLVFCNWEILPKSVQLCLTKQIVHAFISYRLDYCNSIFSCLSKSAIARLQLVPNAAARLLTNTKQREHIPFMANLHRFPVCFRIWFKILLITFKALHGTILHFRCYNPILCTKITQIFWTIPFKHPTVQAQHCDVIMIGTKRVLMVHTMDLLFISLLLLISFSFFYILFCLHFQGYIALL